MPQAVQGAEGPAVPTTRCYSISLQGASSHTLCRIFFALMAPEQHCCIIASSFQCNFKLRYNLLC